MDQQIVQILLGGIASLAGAVGFLYRQQKKSHEGVAVRLADCEDDRLSLWKSIAAMKGVTIKEAKEDAK